MSKGTTFIFTSLLFIITFTFQTQAQSTRQNKIALAACNNEDFEAGPGGAITATSSLSGWQVTKLVLPTSPLISNCALYTSPLVSYTNPTAAYLFTANGYIDTLLGANYPVYSVFGSGASNGGELYNPEITSMYGNSFFRIGDASGTSYNHHVIEKTINVTAANSLFRFAYLPVLKMGTSCCDAPSVQVRFLNASQGNTLLACPVYSVNAPNPGCINPNAAPMIVSTNTSIPSLGTYYHKWKIAAVDLSPYIGSNITFKMIVTYCSTGCSKYSYCYLDAQCSPMQVFVNGTPFPANTNSVTFTGCGVSSATVVAPPDFGNYIWTGPAGFSSTLSTITTSLAGLYTLNMATSGTCSNIVKYVNIQLSPMPTVTAVSSKTLICNGNTATFTLGGLTSYSINGQATGTLASVNPTVTKTYTINGFNAAGCPGSKTISIAVNPCTGIDNPDQEHNRILLFPNPASHSIFLYLDKTLLNGLVNIRNALGKQVIQERLPKTNNEIMVSHLAKGIYFYDVLDQQKIISRGKLIIE